MKAKRLLYFILTALFAQNLWAQESTVKTLRIVYNSIYSIPIQNKQNKDAMYLEIQDDRSIFYSHFHHRTMAIIDSLNQHRAYTLEQDRKLTSPYREGQWYYIYKGFPTEEKLTFIDTNLANFRYEEEQNDMKWKMLGKDSIIAGYPCQLATTNFHGKTWKAWFTLDIPIPNGPWKLGGLPGLILKATDSKGFYSFECAGIQNITAQPIAIPKKDYETIKPKDYFYLQRLLNEDPKAFMRRIGLIPISAETQEKPIKISKPFNKEAYIETY